MPTAEPNNAGDVKAALNYAQSLAQSEIQSIERLHARTLRYIAVFAGVFTVILAILGFIGYANIRDSATEAAKSAMHNEISAKVDEDLKTYNVKSQVDSAVIDFTNKRLDDAVVSAIDKQRPRIYEITRFEANKVVSAQAPELKKIALAEAQRITKERLAARHLGTAQRQKLTNALKLKNGFYVGVVTDTDSERIQFARELQSVFTEAGWKPDFNSTNAFNHPYGDFGLEVLTPDLDHPKPGFSELKSALDMAGLHYTVRGGSSNALVLGVVDKEQ